MNQKTTTHKLMAVLLALMMVLGMLPMAASAARTVSSIVITDVTEPVIGASLSFNWTIPDDAEYEKFLYDGEFTCAWVRTDHVPVNVADLNMTGIWSLPTDTSNFNKFEDGYYYTFYTMLTEKDAASAVITNDTTATLNGEEANVTCDSLKVIWYCFGGLADTEPGDEPGDEEPGDEPGDEEPGDDPREETPGDEPGDEDPDEEPGDEPGDEEPGDEDSDENPDTGDNSNLVLWLALMFAAGIGVVATFVLGKKKYSR